MTQEIFNGPLFIVGMPRSGTKLLRTLLNEHPKVFIPNVETHFLPHWQEEWASFGDLSNQHNFATFYEVVNRLPYFSYLGENQKIISQSDWYRQCESYSLSDVYKALVMHDALYDGSTGAVWGDKTPSYIGHMMLLKDLFPSARFIHIVRDVRDFCLSSKQAWGKSMLRAAQLWADGVGNALSDGDSMGSAHLRLRYEDLVNETETQLRKVCHFIGIDFDPSMLSPGAITENLGDAKGLRGVMSGNTEKYITRMGVRTREKIESIAATQLRALGYPVSYSGEVRRLPAVHLTLLKTSDGFNLLRFEAANRGVFEALKLRWRLYAVSGNRKR